MNEKLKELQLLNLCNNQEDKKKLIEILKSFYFPEFKIETNYIKKEDYYIVSIGTLIRLEKDKVWYDIPLIHHYHITNLNDSELLFGIYTEFLKKVEIKRNFYIVENRDFKSIFQITEKERLYRIYKDIL